MIYFLLSRHISSSLLIFIILVFIISIVFVQPLNQLVFSQGDTDPPMIMSQSQNSEESITSYYDALIKAPLLVSQCTIVGIVFSQLILSRIFYSRKLMKFSERSVTTQIFLGTDKRLSLIIILSTVVLCVSSSSFLILQIYNLSSELGLNFSDTYSIVMNTSLYTVWLLRIITSILILVLSLIFYCLSGNNLIGRRINENSPRKVKNKILWVIFICGSINIISNGIVSHNAATEYLPWLAISADWVHFMAVSIWLGGLFYISLILLRVIRTSSSYLEHGRELDTTSEQIVARNSFSLALMLPSFSMIAVICLGVIGVSGLYMAWVQLQSAQSLFDSVYGNILILKLCVIVPMIALGGYHQIKLHLVMVQIAQRANKSPDQVSVSSNVNRGTSYDPFTRFSKTIKVEALIGISVLIISSFLTITSPPSMIHSGIQMQMDGSQSANNNPELSGGEDHSEMTPKFTYDFTIAALVLTCIVLFLSFFYFQKSKRELKATLDLLQLR